VVVGIVAVVLVALAGTQYQDFDYRLHPERKAYDDGAVMASVRAGTSFDAVNCISLAIERDQMVAGRYAAHLEAIDRFVLEASANRRTKHPDSYGPEHDEHFLAGFWDKMMERCPGLVDVRPATGRP
jgi:hypothetical protein